MIQIVTLCLLISLGVHLTEATCNSGEFTCNNGDCINEAQRCDGNADCYDETDETLANCINTRCSKSFQCDYGGCIREDKVCDGTEDCNDGSDEFSCTKTSSGARRKECALPSDRNGSLYLVLAGGSWVQADSAGVAVSTVVRVRCQTGYGLPRRGDDPICGSRGTWSPYPPSCTECGRRKTNRKTRQERDVVLLLKNAPVAKTIYTWHVALYNVTKAGDKDFYYNICGGSILSKRTILTAAHCVADKTSGQLWVSIGKSIKDWYIKEGYQQGYEVRQIIVHEGYNTTSFQNDIAILIVGEMKFNLASMPVCIDWTSEHWNKIKSVSLQRTYLQTIGWGETEDFTMSKELREAKLPYYDNSDCRRHLANHADEFDTDFIEKITQDKFCVGVLNGTYLYKGDSGGGVTYSVGTVNDEEVHFIYGIVSFTDSKNKQLTAITNVGMYKEWLKNNIK